MALCTRCGKRESTGFVFAMCDECFDAFEAQVQAANRDLKQIEIDAQAAFIVPEGMRLVNGVLTDAAP